MKQLKKCTSSMCKKKIDPPSPNGLNLDWSDIIKKKNFQKKKIIQVTISKNIKDIGSMALFIHLDLIFWISQQANYYFSQFFSKRNSF